MKIEMAIVAVCLAAKAASATASDNNYAAVTNDWYNGNFTNVYELAQQRLAVNSNDVVGAYLMLNWDISFSRLDSISNSVDRVISSADMIEETTFSNIFWKLRPLEIDYRDNILPSVTEEQLMSEADKAAMPGKEMPDGLMLKILWDCGLW